MKSKYLFIFALIILTLGSAVNTDAQKYGGFRASRILGSYPNRQFPVPGYWSYVSKQISQKFSGYTPGGIWIVSLYMGEGVTMTNFPAQGLNIPNVDFYSVDQNEEFLSKFDSEGVKVWLQVEPGAASVDTLISVVLNRYKNHPCVMGFGVDVEWLDAQTYNEGRHVTDAEAKRWEEKVKSINSNYTLFLKHYAQNWMPPSYRGDIYFIDDSQGFTSFNSIISEFKAWGNSFSKNKVGFQFGYEADKTIWSKYSDPVAQIGNELIKQIPNCATIIWVDFTITQIFPVTDVKTGSKTGYDYNLYQNYPNPFNPSTKIAYTLKEKTKVSIKIYDMLGREVMTLLNQEQIAGPHEISFANNSEKLASGMYIYRMITKNFSQSKKFVILK